MFIFACASATASRAAPASALGTMLASSMRRLQPADRVRYTTSPVLRSLAVTRCGWLLRLGALAFILFPLRPAPLVRLHDNIGFTPCGPGRPQAVEAKRVA